MKRSQESKGTEVSIVIAVYNAQYRIRQVVDALLSQRYHGTYEIILVNDGSTDDTPRILKDIARKHHQVKVFTKENGGAGSARNFGIRKSSGKYIVITDDDVILDSDWLKKTIPIISDQKIGFVSTVIKNNMPKGMTRFERLMFDYAMTSRCTNKDNEGVMFMSNATRKDVLKKVGLYEETFDGSAAGADVDLILRIRDSGYITTESKAKATHLEEKKRFQIGFFIKKPYSWGQALAKVVERQGFKHILWRDRMMIFPSIIVGIMLLVASFFISIYLSLALIVLGALGHAVFRHRMMLDLAKRGHNIFEMILIVLLDALRVLMYNLGSLKYFFSGKGSRISSGKK